MVNSVNSISTSSVQSTSTSGLSEEEKKKKAEEEGLLSMDNNQETLTNTAQTTTLTEDTAKSEALSYINTLKAQYPQLAAKLDSYYSNLDFATLCSEAASTTDIRAYIYSETQSFLN